MPIYLVRWPTLRASLVYARNRDELLDTLDQVDDPGGCTFQVYRGPVWIDFELPFRIRDVTPDKKIPTEPADYTVDPAENFTGELAGLLAPDLPPADDVHEMCESVLRGAFPRLHAHIERERERDFAGPPEPPEAPPEKYPPELRAALVAELEPLVRQIQAEHALHARNDYEAGLMKQMRVTTMLPFMKRAVERTLKEVPARDAD